MYENKTMMVNTPSLWLFFFFFIPFCPFLFLSLVMHTSRAQFVIKLANLLGQGKRISRLFTCCKVTAPNSNNVNAFGVHSKLCSIIAVATKVHVILRSFVVLTWTSDTIKLVQHVTLWNLNSFSSHLRWCGSLHLAFPTNVAYACTNIQQVASAEEEEGDTPHIDTWCSARVWVDFFGGLH